MASPGPVQCAKCGRANSASATLCLWCGNVISVGAPVTFEPRQAELDYVGGIERLNDPTPVKLTISEAGIEIVEIMPGSRRIVIAAESIVDALVTGGGTPADYAASSRPWWRRIGKRRWGGKQGALRESHDYKLTIRFRDGETVQSAVFLRRGSTGLLMIQGLARAVASLLRLR